MHIDMLLLFLFILSFLAFVSNRILSRYLYMTAGLKSSDAMIYLSQLWNDGMHRNRQERLMSWLEYRSGYAKEFYTMARYYNACSWPTVVYLLGAVALSMAGFSRYTWVMGVTMVVVWAILTLLGFRYGKYIESETADYFDTSRYKPYEPEEPDDSSEPYYDSTPTGPFATGDTEDTERRRFRNGYARNILAVVLILAFVLVPVLSQKFSRPTTSTPEATTQPSEFPSAQPTSAGTPEAQAMYDRLDQEGFHPLNAVGQLSDTYPGIILSDGILVEEEGLHLEYLVLTQESQAKDLAQGLQHQLYELVAARDPDITEESGEGYTLYTQETEGDYGVVVRDGTNILYVYCPQYDTTWMKWFLNDLGYLSDY
ncbi:hypothetical protein B5F12_08420 [Pseudoflavonifractor sp. An176]|uniref:hypothetical protein n=1 Tax=Pseudoflavonifractor sp. An176 TaxID=1965572 RepID=UPI000B368C5A|nr:hypothetical protein [Pseudoflavonifractor sp. An176]OUP63259.1 hypothetical protein B5F12_08420 [Pseudoflavonifractor sp. An176]